MFVLSELKKSIKTLEKIVKEVNKIDNITDIDAYETEAQKVVFNLQMQANQVAGELVPLIKDKRTSLQYSCANDALARIRAAQEEVQETIQNSEKNEVVEEASAEPEPEPEQPKVEEKVEEKVEDGGDSNRQRESNTRNSKPKSTEETK